MKQFLLKSSLVFFVRIFIEQIHYTYFYFKYMANRNNPNSLNKMQADLSIRTHALEKGMSIGNGKIGFGKPKAIALIKDLNKYKILNGKTDFLTDSCNIINKYIQYNINNGAKMDDVKSIFDEFVERNEINLSNDGGGIINLTHQSILEGAQGNFSLLSQNRYTVRDFGDDKIPLSKIEEAIKLCERTPSACNRQSWRVHLISNNTLKNWVFNSQLGCNGFYEKMQYAIIICADVSYYGFPEFNQAYVDGGLYAMNLMYALNYHDIATIPLTMQHKYNYTKNIKKKANIPVNEIPVILIGIGSYKEQFKVACSSRNSYTQYTTIHQ